MSATAAHCANYGKIQKLSYIGVCILRPFAEAGERLFTKQNIYVHICTQYIIMGLIMW